LEKVFVQCLHFYAGEPFEVARQLRSSCSRLRVMRSRMFTTLKWRTELPRSSSIEPDLSSQCIDTQWKTFSDLCSVSKEESKSNRSGKQTNPEKGNSMTKKGQIAELHGLLTKRTVCRLVVTFFSDQNQDSWLPNFAAVE
jgi:hypothetical protein